MPNYLTNLGIFLKCFILISISKICSQTIISYNTFSSKLMGEAKIVRSKSVNIADQLYFSVICGLVLLKLMSLWTNSLRSINAVPQSLQPKSVLRNICLCTNFTWAKFQALLFLINMPLTAAHFVLTYIGSLEIVFFKFGPFPASFSLII